MRIRYLIAMLVLLAFFASYSFDVESTGIDCTVVEEASCTAAKLLYLRNDSGGFYNAHAQLTNVSTYPYVLCCDAVARNDILNTSCTDSAFLRLYSQTDSHVQVGNLSSYPHEACINAVNGNVSCTYSQDSCPSNYDCLLSIASSETANNNITNAHASNCSRYNTKICCNINSPPDIPVLVYPENISAVTNRTPNFRWNATDPDNDSLTFELYIVCNGGCSADNRAYTGLNYHNYTIPAELKYFGDDNYWYTWYVRSQDNSAYSQNATAFNFTLSSLIQLTLINENMSFGSLGAGLSNDTTDDLPPPFALRNDGNSFVDVNISATEWLWDSRQYASSFFQYKANTYAPEPSSFNTTSSVTSWTDIPVQNATFMRLLNYTDATDTGAVDIRIEVPMDEGMGNKSATIVFTGMYVRYDI